MDGDNWYVYCGNDPINMVDPSGMWISEIHEKITSTAAKQAGITNKFALAGLKAGCTYPDRMRDKTKKYKDHRYHGQKDYYNVMVKQIKAAKKIRKKK